MAIVTRNNWTARSEPKSNLLTLFAKKEPTADAVAIKRGKASMQDTALYRDPDCTQLVVRWPWQYTNCPKPGQREVTYNCSLWEIVWL